MKIGKRYGVDHFRKLLQTPDATSLDDLGDAFDKDAGLVSVCAGVPIEKADGGDRRRTFTISTGAVDRHGDTIAPRGWQLDNFKAGGTVLFGHSSFHPIGRPVKTWVARGPTALKSTADFADTPFAAEIFGLIEGGFLRSSSVGFRPKEWEVAKDRAEEGEFFMPLDFKSQELLEWSVVPVPANPEALVEAAAKGCRLDAWKEWAEKALDGEGGAHIDLVVRREDIEIGRKALGAAKVFSTSSAPQEPAEEPAAETEVKADEPATRDAIEQELATDEDEPGIVELVDDLKAAQDAAAAKAAVISDKLEELVCDAVSSLTDALDVVSRAQDSHGVKLTDDLLAALRDASAQIHAALPQEETASETELDLEDLDEGDIKSLGSLAASVASAAVDQALGRVPD